MRPPDYFDAEPSHERIPAFPVCTCGEPLNTQAELERGLCDECLEYAERMERARQTDEDQ